MINTICNECMKDKIEIEVTGAEASLVVKYSALFPEEAELFEKVAGKPGYHKVFIDKMYLEMLVADLVHYLQQVEEPAIQDKLIELCEILDNYLGR